MQEITFYFFSCTSIFFSIFIIVSKNTIKSALFLILLFISISCIWLILEAEFLAIILILVYVGAVTILFLFIIMMIDQKKEIKTNSLTKYYFINIIISMFILYIIFIKFYYNDYDSFIIIPTMSINQNNTKILGVILYTNFLIPFIITSILLLIGLIASANISFRGKQKRLSQNIFEQIHTNYYKRIKLIK